MTFHQGCIEAWVRAAIEILIGWKPYCYDFLVDVSVGVKADLGLFRLKVELGCMLHIWGPEFSGIAKIKLWIISFSIPFGSGKQEDAEKTISVKEFRESFLPESGCKVMEGCKVMQSSRTIQGETLADAVLTCRSQARCLRQLFARRCHLQPSSGEETFGRNRAGKGHAQTLCNYG